MNDLQSNFYSVKIQKVLFQHKGRVLELSVRRYLAFSPANILWKVSIGSPLHPASIPSPHSLIVSHNKVVIANATVV